MGGEPGAALPRFQVGAVVCCVLSVNTGYLGYPLTVALLGRDQLSTAVLYDVLVTGPCLLLGAFAVGAAFGTKAGEAPRQRVRAFFTRNPPLYAAIAGILAPEGAGADSPGRRLPGADRRDPADRLLRRRRDAGRERRARRAADAAADDTAGGARDRHPARHRAGAADAARGAADRPPAAYRLLSAMPSGLNSLVVAHAYGLDMEITAEAVTWSTAIVVGAALSRSLF